MANIEYWLTGLGLTKQGFDIFVTCEYSA